MTHLVSACQGVLDRPAPPWTSRHQQAYLQIMIETLILTTLVGRVVAHYADKALPLIDDNLRRMFEQAQKTPRRSSRQTSN